MFPNKIPNLNQSLLSGVSICEFIKPSVKKIIDNINAQILISLLFNSGHKKL